VTAYYLILSVMVAFEIPHVLVTLLGHTAEFKRLCLSGNSNPIIQSEFYLAVEDKLLDTAQESDFGSSDRCDAYAIRIRQYSDVAEEARPSCWERSRR
jgi:hypothetical protein